MSNKILVVDDEPDIRWSLKALLSRRGYAIEEAEDGQVALAKLKVKNAFYHLLILDLLMPCLNGYEVLRQLPATIRNRMPVILLTAKAEDQDILKGYAAGATYYIPKPYRNQQILNIANYFLGGLPHAQREALEIRL